jgi:hypothetical protein
MVEMRTRSSILPKLWLRFVLYSDIAVISRAWWMQKCKGQYDERAAAPNLSHAHLRPRTLTATYTQLQIIKTVANALSRSCAAIELPSVNLTRSVTVGWGEPQHESNCPKQPLT